MRVATVSVQSRSHHDWVITQRQLQTIILALPIDDTEERDGHFLSKINKLIRIRA